VPPFVIFSDRTVHEMCRKFPVRSSQLLDIDGVGKKKLREYGKYFMDAIYDFLKRNPGAQIEL
jgi:ATP-dependent DNA helicase RecQ